MDLLAAPCIDLWRPNGWLAVQCCQGTCRNPPSMGRMTSRVHLLFKTCFNPAQTSARYRYRCRSRSNKMSLLSGFKRTASSDTWNCRCQLKSYVNPDQNWRSSKLPKRHSESWHSGLHGGACELTVPLTTAPKLGRIHEHKQKGDKSPWVKQACVAAHSHCAVCIPENCRIHGGMWGFVGLPWRPANGCGVSKLQLLQLCMNELLMQEIGGERSKGNHADPWTYTWIQTVTPGWQTPSVKYC